MAEQRNPRRHWSFGRSAAALLLFGVASLAWVRLAFAGVPLEMDPTTCRRELLPQTEDELRRVAAVPILWLVVCVAAASVVAGQWATSRRPDAVRWIATVMVGSAICGGVLVVGSYAVGDLFSTIAVVLVALVVLVILGVVLAVGGATGGAGAVALRLGGVVALQVLVLPVAMMASTFTGEVFLC